MRVYENGAYTPEYLAERERIELLKAERGATKPFEVGKSYKTVSGKTVTCIELNNTIPGYETARFDDGEDKQLFLVGGETVGASTGWRYNRDGIDRGRVTGTAFDHSDPGCVIPEPADPAEPEDEVMHSSDAAIAIGEDAFAAGWKTALELFDYGPYDYPLEMHQAWSAYDPPEELKGVL